MEKKPLTVIKGMSIDTKHEYQPEGTYRYALNLVRETDVGEIGSVSNERGNEVCFEHNLGGDYHLVGSCNISDTKIVLFFTDGQTTVIGIQENCKFDMLIRTDCLDISTHYYVDIQYRIHNGCDTIIYFTDRHNKYRSINLDKLDRYKKIGRIENANDLVLGEYGWDCGLFNISPDYLQPDIVLKKIITGGRLRIGSYQFAVRYLDDQYNATGWSQVSNPVYVNDGDTTDTVTATGGYLSLPDQDGFVYASKTIVLQINNLDTRYKYYQVAILQATINTTQVNETHVSDRFVIVEDNAEFRLNTTSSLPTVSLLEVVVNNRILGTVQSHAQVENKLLLGNLTSPENDWQEFQRIASDIQVEYFVYKGESATDSICEYDLVHGDLFDSNSVPEASSYSGEVVTFDNKTYMRDEVYALGIVFVFNDGNESPVMHIPGRVKIGAASYDSTPTYTVNGYGYTGALGNAYFTALGENFRVNPSLLPTWDDIDYPIESTLEPYLYSVSGTGDFENDTVHVFEDYYTSADCDTPSIPRWKHINTSIKYDGDASTRYTGQRLYKVTEIGLPAYYETDTTYPDVRGCDGLPIFPYYIEDDEIKMQKIRHHRMPDSRKVPIQSKEVIEGADVLQIQALGLVFSNVVIPATVQDRIQGYYFVRGDRAGNKTVIDKGYMNVCDLSTSGGGTPQPVNTENMFLQTNIIFMSPTFKRGMGVNAGEKNPEGVGGFDVVELFTPKMMYNSYTNIGGRYFKLENTMYGDRTFIQRGDDLGGGYKVGMSSLLTNIAQPRIANYSGRNNFALHHTIPIDKIEFALYNTDSASTMRSGFLIVNDRHRQAIGLATLYSNNYWQRSGATFYKLFNRPYQYVNINESNGFINSGKADIVPINFYSGYNTTTPSSSPNRGWGDNVVNITLERFFNRTRDVPSSGNYLGGVLWNEGNSSSHIFSVPYTYYVAVKADIIPYRKLESIKYIRTTNYLIRDMSASTHLVAAGDCFISPMRVFKSYVDASSTNENNRKYVGTLLVGLVESEINNNYRHKETGDLYLAYPFDGMADTTSKQLEEISKEIRETVDHLYKYRLDYSRDNSARLLSPLPDYYDYCAECQERFPNLIVHSRPSTAEQVFDSYREFSPNSIIEIAPDTGDIMGMIVKENNLFVHTQGNTWRLNISSQEIATNNDTVKVGSASLATAVPSRMFDNSPGIFRGGIEYGEAGQHCDDMYIWPDSVSGHVFALQGGVKELSEEGMKRFFDNNLAIEFNRQYTEVYKRVYNESKRYSHQSTSSRMSVGLMSTFDPDIKRYILTKKDYLLLPQFANTVKALPEVGDYVSNEIYIAPDATGYLRAINSVTVVYLTLNDLQFFINKSWTISYCLKSQSWKSFHSYLPNHMYRDNDTFYSFIENNQPPDSIQRAVWRHHGDVYQSFYGIKHDTELELIHNSDPYVDKTFDNVELVSSSYLYSPVNNSWIEVQWNAVDRFYAYNNNQMTGIKTLSVGNLTPYSRIAYNVNAATIVKDRNVWRVSRIRDMSVNRSLNTQPMFTTSWSNLSYRNSFGRGFGYTDKVINANYISSTKNVYQMERLTDKFLGVRYYYKPVENYKITINLFNTLQRKRT